MPCARRIHQDPPHHLRGNCEELGTVLPLDAAPPDQPQVRFIDQFGRLPAVTRSFPGKESPRHLTQLVLDENRQLTERAPLAAAPRLEKRRDVPNVWHGSGVYS